MLRALLNDVSCETRITDDIYFAWQAQYLVKLVTLVAPRIVNDASQVRRINHEIHFSCQAQYLVKLECDFSWQAQHFVQFWEIARARNVVFFHTKCVSKMQRVRSPRDDDFMAGSWSEYPRIVFLLAKAIQGFSADILNSEFHGRRSFW